MSDNPDMVPAPLGPEEVPTPTIGQSPTYEASVQRWRLGVMDGDWFCVPSALWGLFTQLQAVGWEEYQAQYDTSWEPYKVDGPAALYFRDPERISGGFIE